MGNVIKWILIILVGQAIFVSLLGTTIIYFNLFVRTSKKKWGRSCSMPSDPEGVEMYEEGLKWAKDNGDVMEEVGIVNEDFHLYGQYFDFGSKKCVIIIPGRMESCIYSDYFGCTYKDAGFNVLTIDSRAHGLSDGVLNRLGYREYRDIIAWAKFLHDEKGIETITLHGICIGASTSMFTLTADNCPDYIDGLVVEGMYVNFYESCYNHMLADNRPIFPFFYLLMFFIRIFSWLNPKNDGPLNRMPKLRKPILMLHSKLDKFSLPNRAQDLYDTCTSEKELVWFEKGGHSRVRINNKEQYDEAIKKFITKYYS